MDQTKIEKQQRREAKELARRERQVKFKENKFYIIYLFMILSLVFITDEIASTISIQFQSNIVNEFFVDKKGMTYIFVNTSKKKTADNSKNWSFSAVI